MVFSGLLRGCEQNGNDAVVNFANSWTRLHGRRCRDSAQHDRGMC
jgi:hypothetical protein